MQETRPRGKAEAPWVYSGGFQIPPRAWRGPRGTGQHTQSPRRAPHWLAVTSPLCQHRGVDSFPPGFMERDLTRPGLHPTPHTRPHTGPLFWGLGAKAPRASRRCLLLHPLHGPGLHPSSLWERPVDLEGHRAASGMGLRPTFVGPSKHRPGPHRPQRSQKGTPLPGPKRWQTPILGLWAIGQRGGQRDPPW